MDLKDIGVVLNVRLSKDMVSAVWNGKIVSLCNSDRQGTVSTIADEPLQRYGCGETVLITSNLQLGQLLLVHSIFVGLCNICIFLGATVLKLKCVLRSSI